MIPPYRDAALIAPDRELQTEFSKLLSMLQPYGAPALRATLGFTSYAELWRYQEKALRETSDTVNPPMPYWLRSSHDRHLLACLSLVRRKREATAYLATALQSKDLWPALLPALARRAALDEFDTLFLEAPTLTASIQAPSDMNMDIDDVDITGLQSLKEFRACGSGYLLTFAPDPSAANLYSSSASFYDLDLEERSAHDLPFYLRLCREFAPRAILDLACGNGRIALPLLEAGFTVTACDHSSTMLNILRRRLAVLPASTRRLATLYEDSLTSFTIEQQFDLVLVPFRSLQMLSYEELHLCLARIMFHLNPGGHLVFDLANPQKQNFDALLMPESIVWSETDPIDNSRVVKKTWCDLYDRRQQVRHGVIWETTDAAGWRRYEDVLRYRFFTAEQIEYLLAASGLCLLHCYGNFAGNPVGQGEEMIFIAKKLES